MTGVPVGVESKTFDNFALSCYRNCQQYYNLRINLGIVKIGAKKTAADFGSAIHGALEYYYKNGMTEESIDEAYQVFIRMYEKNTDPTDEKRTLVRGLEILQKYFTKYRHEPFNVVATEVGGAVELGEYLYTVRIDLVTEWHNPKGVYGCDHKTTSSIPRMVVKPNNQFTGYEYMLRETYENVIGFIMNVIGVYESDTIIDKNAPKVVSPKSGKLIYATKEREILLRYPTSRTKKEIEDWKTQTISLIHQIEHSTQTNIWDKHAPEFCSAYATRCQFLDIRQAQNYQDIIDPLLAAGIYEKHLWIPYESKVDEIEGGEEG